jgi:hypothetical protein
LRPFATFLSDEVELPRLCSLEPRGCVRIIRLHTQDATPGVGGFTRIAEFFLPQLGHSTSELGALPRISTTQDLVFVHLDHATVVTKTLEQTREFVHDLLIRRRKIVQLLEVLRSPDRIAQLIAAEPSPTPEQLAHERPIEDLVERATERGLDPGHVTNGLPEFIERGQRSVVHVRDERVSNPAERKVGVG